MAENVETPLRLFLVEKKNNLDTRCSCLIIPATYASNRFSAFRQRSAIPLSRENLIEKLRDPAKTSFLPSFLSRSFPRTTKKSKQMRTRFNRVFSLFFSPLWNSLVDVCRLSAFEFDSRLGSSVITSGALNVNM